MSPICPAATFLAYARAWYAEQCHGWAATSDDVLGLAVACYIEAGALAWAARAYCDAHAAMARGAGAGVGR